MYTLPSIILIGPSGVGKSTVGKLLSERLNMPQASLDEMRFRYYAEVGYDAEHAHHLRQTQGFPALITYWAQFNAHAVERVLAEHPDHVIDFGAGHSVYDDPVGFRRAQQALAPYQHVILLLPSADLEKSIQILTERQQTLAPVEDHAIIGDIMRAHVTHPSNHGLAKHTIYTQGKTFDAMCDEIINLL
jgi:shikimate kinase